MPRSGKNFARSASPSQTEMRPASVALLCAEAAWLRGDLEAAEHIITAALPQAIESGEPSQLGALLVWLPRCGAKLPPLQTAIALPYRLEIEGKWQAASDAWGGLGCVYEQALALLAGDEAALRTAFDRFESLGARPAADITRRRLRKLGALGLRRGPYSGSRSDPLGLTLARTRDLRTGSARSFERSHCGAAAPLAAHGGTSRRRNPRQVSCQLAWRADRTDPKRGVADEA